MQPIAEEATTWYPGRSTALVAISSKLNKKQEVLFLSLSEVSGLKR
jgi:hypothetical protein